MGIKLSHHFPEIEVHVGQIVQRPEVFARGLISILQQMRTEITRVVNNNAADSSEWDGNHLTIGNYHIWVDSTGDLRIKSGAPANDTDGTVVGTQS